MTKLQHFGHLMQRTDSLEETLMLGKIEGERRRGQQRMRWLDGITDSTDMSLNICISEVIDIFPTNLDSSLCFIQSSISHDVLCNIS